MAWCADLEFRAARAMIGYRFRTMAAAVANAAAEVPSSDFADCTRCFSVCVGALARWQALFAQCGDETLSRLRAVHIKGRNGTKWAWESAFSGVTATGGDCQEIHLQAGIAMAIRCAASGTQIKNRPGCFVASSGAAVLALRSGGAHSMSPPHLN